MGKVSALQFKTNDNLEMGKKSGCIKGFGGGRQKLLTGSCHEIFNLKVDDVFTKKLYFDKRRCKKNPYKGLFRKK